MQKLSVIKGRYLFPLLMIISIVSVILVIVLTIKSAQTKLNQGKTLPTPQGKTSNLDLRVKIDTVWITPAEKEDMIRKVINPFLDYYKNQEGTDFVKSLSITNNVSATSGDYPFFGAYELGDGTSGGFLIEKQGDEIAWWKPICLEKCKYSEQFISTYPEIIKESR